MTAGLNNNAEATAEPVPSGLKLFSHQEEGVRFAINRLRTNRGAMFGDIMGLGKTIEAIVTANAMVPHRILVVCPASVLFTWRREIWKWQTLGLPVLPIQAGLDTTINHGLFRWGVNGPPARVALCRKEWREKMPRRRQISMSRTATEIPNAPLPSFPRGKIRLLICATAWCPRLLQEPRRIAGRPGYRQSWRSIAAPELNDMPGSHQDGHSRRQVQWTKASSANSGLSVCKLERHRLAGTGPRYVLFGLVRYREINLWVDRIRAARPPRCHSATPTRPRPKPSPSNRSVYRQQPLDMGRLQAGVGPDSHELAEGRVAKRTTGTGY